MLMQKNVLSFVGYAAIALATLMPVASKPVSAQPMVNPSSAVPFTTYMDTWPYAQNRWWDIASYDLAAPTATTNITVGV